MARSFATPAPPEQQQYYCNHSAQNWLQAAMYWASGRDGNGTRVRGPVGAYVVVSPGTVRLDSVLPVWNPYGTSTGLHVPPSVHLTALCPDAAGAGAANITGVPRREPPIRGNNSGGHIRSPGVPGGNHSGSPIPSAAKLDDCPTCSDFAVGASKAATVITVGPSAGNASQPLWSVVLLAGARMFWAANATPPPSTNSSITGLVVVGLDAMDTPEWNTCVGSTAAAQQPPSAVAPGIMRAERGVFVPHAVSGVGSGNARSNDRDNTDFGVGVFNCTVLHTIGNGIETGVFDQWTPENAADASDPACANGTRWCRGRVLGFNGSAAPTETSMMPRNCTTTTPSAVPARITGNALCDTRFGGITIIGHAVVVEDNAVAVSGRAWVSPSQQSGTTMGISAAFVGSSHVMVRHNLLLGGDYGVGSDGSFPLYVSIAMFLALWPEVYARGSPAFRQRYSPAGPPLDKQGDLAFATVQDFVDAQQVLLDLAVQARVASSDPVVYDAGFGVDICVAANTVRGSVVGVSLYRQRLSAVVGNTVEAATPAAANANNQTQGMWGLLLDHSHNCSAAGNRLAGWHVGVMVRGEPGTLSRLGGSFSVVGDAGSGGGDVDCSGDMVGGGRRSGVSRGAQADENGGNQISNCNQCVRFWGAGWDNAVRNNTCVGWESKSVPCDYTGGQRMHNDTTDWTTRNTPLECNADYGYARTGMVPASGEVRDPV